MCGDVGVKHDLVQHVAKLFEHAIAVARLDGFDQLVGFFNQILHERLVGLLAVPRAPARGSQFLEQFDEFDEFRMRRHGHTPL